MNRKPSLKKPSLRKPSLKKRGPKSEAMQVRRRRGVTAAIILLAAISSNACSLYRAHAPEHPGVTDSDQVVWSYAWGLVPGIPKIDCQGQALAEVTVKSNFGFDVLSVITLGLVSPKRFEWKCAGATPTEGTLGAALERLGPTVIPASAPAEREGDS